ncbi:MAG TPA: hypothetical protein VEX68_09375 [Bryobacteraceae bacterium]|nr:hypothetical protein [Bryobacteraceae bacterium]
MKWRWIAITAFVVLAACQRSNAPAGFTIRHKPPERKDVIEAVLASYAVPLSTHSSCKDIGTDADDKTIGAYLSGFLSELEKPEDRNSIATSIAEADGKSVWRCELIIRHAAGDDEWGWGVRFDIRQSDGQVVPESFVCLGAG